MLLLLKSAKLSLSPPFLRQWSVTRRHAAAEKHKLFFSCVVWHAGMLLISEWWASETAVMMGGLLPDAQRQLSAMAIYQTTNAMCFMLPLGIAVAVSTR
jgi:hypothetical protein